MEQGKLKGIDCFISFKKSVENIPLPKLFTFPFYYTPHPLCLIAVEEIKKLIINSEWDHNFGLNSNSTDPPVGKMFGVLVVKNKQGQLGYLAGYSGKIGEVATVKPFVPPIFNRLAEDSFFKSEEMILNSYNAGLKAIEESVEFAKLILLLDTETKEADKVIMALRDVYKKAKKSRRKNRNIAKSTMNEVDFENFQEKARKESLKQQHAIKKESYYRNEAIEKTRTKVNFFADKAADFKQKRKEKSALLQKWLFDQYKFLNINNKQKNLWHIFKEELKITPPAGAGDCAAPKLLQYAFKNQLKPVAIAEFWWGDSPASAIRKHLQFYPACKGKCEPILGHMLKGMDVDENPMLENPAEGRELEVFYEDDDIAIINKPSEFLSVPGKNITDSVYSRMVARYPDATGPLLVHRLDMSTSGILLIAKNKDAHKFLQSQFIKRTVKKRYVALLDGIVDERRGEISLPLRVDLDNRPYQLVCYDYGKTAKTNWEVIEIKDQKTKIYLYPATGRTHQLRVHCAFKNGLNAPIIGDDLYGKKSNRLHLHAEFLEFIHPTTKKTRKIRIPAEF
jgi:tRNA pseudouridine32 synthase/23S rRNA pseudouridine746 synthase